ncbi:Oar protein [Acidisarcina polymorpha]|uniref:Oar protein n=2 Tax=Acidisarcina polymorpha TaxID=2211140 RepID=A0A2Z5G0L1_9BACT|nr:Oar protein [Acidisarcina polymorpha]
MLSFTAPVLAQTAGTGSIQGSVLDQTGAAIPNATVTATDVATQVKHAATSSSTGLYSFPSLPIGNYLVDSDAAGFQHYRQSNIVLDVGSSIAVNVSMKPGNVNQVVEVRAAGLALQTEDSSLKQTVDEKTLTALPLNGRQMTDLVTLMGGAVNANEGNDVQGSKTFYSSAVISIAGGQGNFTDYRLDGGDHNDYMTNINLPFPFPDAVAQFSVETTDLGAQSGLHPGGLVNVVTRSGSNDWHGSAFEFIRNNYIDATNFFSTSKDTLHQNQFGGTFGGRIIRDKLFFFAGYQRLNSGQSQSLTPAYVPTAANLAGDFSATENSACQTSPIQLVNPQTGALLPNNHIDPSLFNVTALALDKYLPAPTNACGLVTFAIPSKVTENQFVTRGDWSINAQHSLYGRYWIDDYQHPAFFSPTNILITGQTGNYERVQSITLGETYIPTPHLVNTFHATGSRRRINRGPAPEGINPATLGIDMYSTAPVSLNLQVTDKWSIYSGAPATFNVNTFAFADDITWVHGKHQIAFGGEFVRSQFNENNVYQGNGSFNFSGVYSQFGPAGQSPGATGADANLDFLTGSMNSFEQSSPQLDALRAPIPSLYIMDTYHLNDKIVLTGGVRWAPEFFPTDYFGRGSTFSIKNFLNGTVSSVYPNAPAGSLFYGDAGVPKAMTKNSLWQFSPRAGATIDLKGDGKLVFRVGGAMVYDLVNFFMGQNMNVNPPFSQSIANNPVNQPLNFSSPWSNGTVTTNPFPAPIKPNPDIAFQPGSQYIVLPRQYQPPVMFQYTVSIQQEFAHGWQFQIDYIGNRTNYNSYALPMSPAVYIPGNCGDGPCSTLGNTASRFSLTLANPAAGPYYAGGGQGSTFVVTGANSSYNGLITTIQHRLSSSFVLMANYTWSHCIDIADSVGDTEAVTVQDPANIKADRANCGFDFRHVFNTLLVATSHFPLTGAAGLIVNHWEFAPLVHATDGAPFTVITGVDNSLTDIGNDRPDLVPSTALYTHNKIKSGQSINAQFINPGAFAPNAIGTYGSVARDQFRGPKFLQVDSALSRILPIHERLNLALRLEAFNLLNHPNFATPESGGYIGQTTSLTSPTFGQITATTNNYGARIFQGAVKLNF